MKNNIQTRLTHTYIGLALVPLIILGLLVTWQGIAFQQAALERQKQLADRVSVEVKGYLTRLVQDLELIVKIESDSELRDEVAFRPMVQVLWNEAVFEEMKYLGPDGTQYNHQTRLGIHSQLDLPNYAGRPEFDLPFFQGVIYYSPIYFSKAVGEPVIDIAIPVYGQSENQTIGVLYTQARLVKIWEIIDNQPLTPGQTVYIIDENGQILAHPDKKTVTAYKASSPTSKYGLTTGLDGGQVLSATDDIQLGKVTLTVVVEQSVLTAYALPLYSVLTTISISLLAFGVAIWAGIRAVRQIVHPIQNLALAASGIRAGNWQHPITVETQDEVGELAEAFNLMVQRLHTSLANLEAEMAEKVQAETALKQTELRYRTLVEQLPAITYIDNAEDTLGETLYISPQVSSILGYTQEEWLQISLEEWLALMVSDNPAECREKYLLCCKNGVPFEYEYCLRGKNGQLVWFHDRAIRLENENQEWIMQGVMVDVTARKKAEEKIRTLNIELERRVFERTQQLEAANQELEAFTYSISHDLRTPLRGIIGFSSLLANNPDNHISPEGQHHLQRVLENTQRMGQMVDDLLKFARFSRQAPTKQLVNTTALVQETLDELRMVYNQREIEFFLRPLPSCEADPTLLRQVFTNIISNAIKYTRDTPQPRIEIGYEAHTPPVYYVRDNGTGFDMQYASKLFGVFERLHGLEEFEGSGVGLAIVQRIIHRHGGKIWAEAYPGKGATFFFTLDA